MTKFCTGARGFNGETQSCCERHDADYSAGSGVSRLQADTALMICVAAHGMPWRGVLMFLVVRVFGFVHYRGNIND